MARSRKKRPVRAPKKMGGARAGAGRPKKDRGFEDFEALAGAPLPEDPLALASFAQRIVVADLQRIISGRGDRQLSQEIRAGARAIAALMPLERIHRAEKTIKGDRDAVKRDGPKGADLEDVDEHSTPVHRSLSRS